MKALVIVSLLCCAGTDFSQESIVAQKEPITFLQLGEKPEEVYYSSQHDGLWSPGSPFVDASGRIVFYKGWPEKVFLSYFRGKVDHFPYRGNLDSFRIVGNRFIKSQQGMLLDGYAQMLYKDGRIEEYSYSDKGVTLEGSQYINYPAPFGAILYSDREKKGIAVTFDVQHPKESFEVVQGELGTWLLNQPGGFSIGEEGRLYRHGMVYSATQPKNFNCDYIGRLASGHVIWSVGPNSLELEEFLIATPQGDIELDVTLPWKDDIEHKNYEFNYGIGSWGELYCLLPPPFITVGDYFKNGGGDRVPLYVPDPHARAELIAIRSHLRYFGRLNDDGVRLREGPTVTSESMGTFPKKTGFRILGQGGRTEVIDGQKSDWVHVRLLDGKEGWFFGKYVTNLFDGPHSALPWPNIPDW